MVAATTTLRVNTSQADRAAAELAAQGVPLAEICARFDPLISPQTARAAIARGRHALDQERPKPVSPQPQAEDKAPAFMAAVELPQPQAKPESTAKPKPKVSIPLEPDELLSWAESDGPSRARILASRVRVQLAELGTLHDKHAETAEARKAVAALEKQLADAKAELRRVTSGGSATASAPAADTGAFAAASSSQIRAWARENGHQVPDRGRVPGHVIAAYRAAHPE